MQAMQLPNADLRTPGLASSPISANESQIFVCVRARTFNNPARTGGPDFVLDPVFHKSWFVGRQTSTPT
jgi:hypothetical protein